MKEETIVAIATPRGEAGIGVIRVSGPDSLNLLLSVFEPKSKRKLEERRFTYGFIKEGDIVIDEVMAVFMKGPNTYTREDVCEIQAHSSQVSLKKILSLLIEKGARLAEPGEFTKRAFLNGRLDLTQAEALMDLISSKTELAHSQALKQLGGHTSEKLNEILDALKEVLIRIAVLIEYPEEDLEEISKQELKEKISFIKEDIERLIDTFNSGRILREGLKVSILGKPNVGKSSLLNALLKEERAIVTELPGTTRDTIEEFLDIEGIPVRIMDTAGIRESHDPVEKEGIKRAKGKISESDLVVLILDGSVDLEKEDREIAELIKDKKTIVLLNKRDLGKAVNTEEAKALFPESHVIETSITENMGLKELLEEISNMVEKENAESMEKVVVTNIRHYELLKKAKESMKDSLMAIDENQPLDIVEIDIKEGFLRVGEILGRTVKEDILKEIFERFCLGK